MDADRGSGGWWLQGSLVLVLGVSISLKASAAVSPYRAPADRMADWLQGQQAWDGSFGLLVGSRCSQAAIRPLCTLEAVRALDGLGRRGLALDLGLAWLGNNAVVGNDFLARQYATLSTAGANASGLSAQLEAAANNGAWGLTAAYRPSVLDTAVVATGLAQAPGVNLAAATQHLVDQRLADGGWAVGQAGNRQVLATAQAVEALAARAEADAAAAAALPAAVTTLKALSPTTTNALSRALVARALVTAGDPASFELNALLGQQISGAGSSLDGSSGGDLRATAITAQALAVLLNAAITDGETRVDVLDAGLRAAINAALGHGAMDRLNRADLARLTHLDASGRDIAQLAGLEWAINLASCNFANNALTSTVPIDALPCRESANLAGNPIPGLAPAVVQVPLLPVWVWLVVIVLLGMLGARRSTPQAYRLGGAALIGGLAWLTTLPTSAADTFTAEEQQALRGVSRAVLVSRAKAAAVVQAEVVAERAALQPIVEGLQALEAAAARPGLVSTQSLDATSITADAPLQPGAVKLEVGLVSQRPATPEELAAAQAQAQAAPATASAPPRMAASHTATPADEVQAATPTATSNTTTMPGSETDAFAATAAELAALKSRVQAVREQHIAAAAPVQAVVQGAIDSPEGLKVIDPAQPGAPVANSPATTPLAAVDHAVIHQALLAAEAALTRMQSEARLDAAALRTAREQLSDAAPSGSSLTVAAPPPLPEPTFTSRTQHLPAE